LRIRAGIETKIEDENALINRNADNFVYASREITLGDTDPQTNPKMVSRRRKLKLGTTVSLPIISQSKLQGLIVKLDTFRKLPGTCEPK
jgi:hypothetical protein